jgi:hypothetical protein
MLYLLYYPKALNVVRKPGTSSAVLLNGRMISYWSWALVRAEIVSPGTTDDGMDPAWTGQLIV